MSGRQNNNFFANLFKNNFNTEKVYSFDDHLARKNGNNSRNGTNMNMKSAAAPGADIFENSFFYVGPSEPSEPSGPSEPSEPSEPIGPVTASSIARPADTDTQLGKKNSLKDEQIKKIQKRISYIKSTVRQIYKQDKHVLDLLKDIDLLDRKIISSRHHSDKDEYYKYLMDKKDMISDVYEEKDINIIKNFLVYAFLKTLQRHFDFNKNVNGDITKHFLDINSIVNKAKFMAAYSLLKEKYPTRIKEKINEFVHRLSFDNKWDYLKAGIYREYDRSVLAEIYKILVGNTQNSYINKYKTSYTFVHPDKTPQSASIKFKLKRLKEKRKQEEMEEQKEHREHVSGFPTGFSSPMYSSAFSKESVLTRNHSAKKIVPSSYSSYMYPITKKVTEPSYNSSLDNSLKILYDSINPEPNAPHQQNFSKSSRYQSTLSQSMSLENLSKPGKVASSKSKKSSTLAYQPSTLHWYQPNTLHSSTYKPTALHSTWYQPSWSLKKLSQPITYESSEYEPSSSIGMSEIESSPNPSWSNPSLSNPSLSNPSLSNPSLSNTSLSNPSLSNPSWSNPSWSNPSWEINESSLGILSKDSSSTYGEDPIHRISKIPDYNPFKPVNEQE